MLRHRTNVDRIQDRRIYPVGLSFDSWYTQNFGAIGWKLQEPSGDVALAINKRVELGRELVREGAFPNNPGVWGLASEWTIAAGKAIYDDTSNGSISQNLPIEASKQYVFSFNISDASGNANLALFDQGGLVALVSFDDYVNGNHSIPFTASTTTAGIRIVGNAANSDSAWKITNVSLKQTDIASDKEFPGSEILSNAGQPFTFTGDNPDDWVITGEVGSNPEATERDSGQLNADTKTVGGALNVFTTEDILRGQNVAGTIGERYLRTVILSAISSGAVSVNEAGSLNKIIYDSVGIFTSEHVRISVNNRFDSALASAAANATIDLISEKPANPINATNNGMAVAQTGQGNIPLVYSGDGGTTRLSFDTIAEINSIINMSNGGFVMAAQSDTWAAGVDVLARFAVDADNEIVIFRDGTDLKIEYRETATSSIVTIPSGSPSGMFTIGGKWNVTGFGLRGLYNGVQVDTDKSIAAAIIGNLDKDECALFAEDSGGTASWAGDGAYPALQTETPDDSFFAEYHSRSGL